MHLGFNCFHMGNNRGEIPRTLVWYCYMIHVKSVYLPGKSMLLCLHIPEILVKFKPVLTFSLRMDSVRAWVLLE